MAKVGDTTFTANHTSEASAYDGDICVPGDGLDEPRSASHSTADTVEVASGSENDASLAGKDTGRKPAKSSSPKDDGFKAFHGDAGTDKDGAVYLEGAVLEGSDSKTGTKAEILGVKVKVGPQSEATATGVHLEVGTNKGGPQRFSMDIGRATAHWGTHNADGSRGFNAGASANVAATEGTVSVGGNSATLGGSVGVGASGSVGVRDADRDGDPELCVSTSVGLGAGVSGGLCLERSVLMTIGMVNEVGGASAIARMAMDKVMQARDK